jgi:hypothetical protein
LASWILPSRSALGLDRLPGEGELLVLAAQLLLDDLDLLQGVLDLAVLLAEVRLRPLALAHVSGDLRQADDPSGAVADGRDRERDMEAAAVPVQALGLEVLHPLAGEDPAVDDPELGLAIGGDEPVDGLADDLGRGVAVHPLGRRVPGEDHPVDALAEDGIGGRLDDGGEPRQVDLGGVVPAGPLPGLPGALPGERQEGAQPARPLCPLPLHRQYGQAPGAGQGEHILERVPSAALWPGDLTLRFDPDARGTVD